MYAYLFVRTKKKGKKKTFSWQEDAFDKDVIPILTEVTEQAYIH